MTDRRYPIRHLSVPDRVLPRLILGFCPFPIGDLVDQQYRASQKHSPIWPIYSVPPAITAPTVVNPEKDKLTKMKQRKEARKERAEKKVKTVIVDGDRETPYDFEKVLLELGEVIILWVKHLQFYVPGKKIRVQGWAVFSKTITSTFILESSVCDVCLCVGVMNETLYGFIYSSSF